LTAACSLSLSKNVMVAGVTGPFNKIAELALQWLLQELRTHVHVHAGPAWKLVALLRSPLRCEIGGWSLS